MICSQSQEATLEWSPTESKIVSATFLYPAFPSASASFASSIKDASFVLAATLAALGNCCLSRPLFCEGSLFLVSVSWSFASSTVRAAASAMFSFWPWCACSCAVKLNGFATSFPGHLRVFGAPKPADGSGYEVAGFVECGHRIDHFLNFTYLSYFGLNHTVDQRDLFASNLATMTFWLTAWRHA